MVNALHLLWIVPVSCCMGLFLAALVSSNSKKKGHRQDHFLSVASFSYIRISPG